MKKLILIVSSALLVSSCGSIVKDGDLQAHLENAKYSKILFRPKLLNCGQFGKGKRFLGTSPKGEKIIGQICYKKSSGTIQYKVSEVQKLDATSAVDVKAPATNVPNPWKK